MYYWYVGLIGVAKEDTVLVRHRRIIERGARGCGCEKSGKHTSRLNLCTVPAIYVKAAAEHLAVLTSHSIMGYSFDAYFFTYLLYLGGKT